IGDGPISNTMILMENNGVLLSRINLGAETLDAISQWSDYDNTPYIILSSLKCSAARSRFDLAHELAHLTFHKKITKNICHNIIEHPIIEQQAHKFASAFLFPSRSFMDSLSSPTLDCFYALKEKWRMSIAAMIMKCRHLGIIEENYERTLWMNYNRRGWAKHEPLDDKLQIEQPKLLPRSFELLINEKLITRENIPIQLPYPVSELEELTNLPNGFLSNINNVEYLPTLRTESRTREQINNKETKVVNFPNRNK
ncbi:MAG: ImmA/IrrE family metallo-endopeptidase, partial [Smithella sp.]